MKSTTVKGFCRLFLNPTAVLIMILLTAIIWVLSSMLGAGYPKFNRRIALLSVTEAPVDIVSHASLTESTRATAEQAGEWQTVRMRVTAYCPCPKCCGEYSDGITACGHKIQPGDVFVAAGIKYLFGTEMSIPGYNHAKPVKVLDRGGAIRGNRLDVFFHSHQEALKWGVKYLDIKV